MKVLFKTNAKSHKHPDIKLLSSESKTQLANQRKQKSYRRVYIYIYIYILTQSFWTGTKVIGRKHIIQPTGFGACSSTCCQWDGEDVPAPWERSNSHPPVRVSGQEVTPPSISTSVYIQLGSYGYHSYHIQLFVAVKCISTT